MTQLTANDLLAGSAQTFRTVIPVSVLPADGQTPKGDILLRPLTVNDVQLIGKAAKEKGVLTSIIMVQQALVEPAMTMEQVGQLPAGLVQFLLSEVNRISGLSLSEDDLQEAVKAPLTKAVFVLAREFGWTPSQCSELTLGQVLLYLEMLTGETLKSEEDAA